jgi:excisionase family DNA binding protein
VGTQSTKQFVPTEDVAKRYGVANKTLVRWGREGRFTLYRVGPRYLRVDPDEVDAAMVLRVPAIGDNHA